MQKFLETKLNNVDSCVKNLINRNLDYVENNKEKLKNFLKEIKIDNKKINIILYVLDCSNVQDFLAVSEEELREFGFSQSEIITISRRCKDELENTVYSDVGM